MNFNRRGTEAKQKINTYTMKKIVIAISILMMSISCGEIFAQKDGFSLHLSGVFPNGKFGEFDEELGADGFQRVCAVWHNESETCSAKFGVGFGVKYQLSVLSVKNLRFLISAEFMYNSLNGDAKDFSDEILMYYKETILSNYLNIPVMVGLNYSIDLNEKVKVYGEFGLGVDLRTITKTSCENSLKGNDFNDYYKLEYKYDNAITFAYQFGVGILFDKVSVGLHYYNLGSAKVKGNVSATYRYNDIYGVNDSEYEKVSFKWKKLSTSMLALRVGYHF